MMCAALAALLSLAQQIGAGQPRFEVASAKPAEGCSAAHALDASMIALRGIPLNVIIMEAFQVKMDQLTGPSWLEQDCFDISAKLPEGATKDQLPAMLQALLAERFKLAVHKESRRSPGYALVVDKSGPKFKESDQSTPEATARVGRVTFGFGPGAASMKGSMTIATLVRYLSNKLRVPVEDLTALHGRYDIDLSWTADPGLDRADPISEPDLAGSVFTSVRESLGLRLEPRKERVEIIVIDHIDRVPTAN